MSQTSVIFAALIIAFIAFVVLRGKVADYRAVFGV